MWARFVPGASGRRADLAAVQVNVVYAALPLVALLVIFLLAISGTDLSAGTFLAFNAALTQVITAVVLLERRCRRSPRSFRCTSGSADPRHAARGR